MLALAVLALAVYANSLRVPFVFDDYDAIQTNPTLRQLWPPWPALNGPRETTVAGRPTLNLSFALNYAISGTSVGSYHAVNILIHVGCACLVFGVLRRMLRSPPLEYDFGASADWLALAIAAIWVVHPLNTMCVTYIVQRAESLMGLFYLGTLYAVIRSANSSRAMVWQAIAILAFLLGIGCKESIATAPIVIFIYDGLFLAGGFRNTLQRRSWFYGILAAGWIPLGLLVASGPRPTSVGLAIAGLSPWQYLRTQPEVLLHYLRLVFVPTPLCLDYDWSVATHWTQIVAAGSIIVCLLAATVWGVIRLRPWSFAGVWFFGTLAVTSSIVPIIIVASEHRMYLPSIAPIALVVILVWHISRNWDLAVAKSVRIAAPLAVIAACALMARARNVDYQSELVLWKHVLEVRPQNARAMTNYGALLESAGRIPEAMPYLKRAVELSPSYGSAHYNFGVALAKSGNVDEAIREFRDCVRYEPNHVSGHYNLGYGLLARGQMAEAEKHLQRAIDLDSLHVAARKELANLLVTQGRSSDAMEHLRIVIENHPNDPIPMNTLAWILATAPEETTRDGEEAVRLASEADRMAPGTPGILDTLAAAYAEVGHFQQAVATGERALATAEARHQTKLSAGILERLTLYRSDQPYRETARVSKP